MRARHLLAVAALAASTSVAPAALAAPGAQRTVEFSVLAAGDNAAAAGAITAAGGRIIARNDAVGLFRVTAPEDAFAATPPQLAGVARRTTIGHALDAQPAVNRAAHAAKDPLDATQWNERMVHADAARAVTTGTHKVTVGIMDTGVDATHPDLAANYNWQLSRNFTTESPGPVGVDGATHGTQMAGIVAAARNGIGISGIAPDVSLVDLRVIERSGYMTLDAFVNALTYAGDAGIDVVNMSFYLDPWLFNCSANPADSKAEQAAQRTIVKAATRALSYAHQHGSTLVAAIGNYGTDLGHPTLDALSPDYSAAGGGPHRRVIDNKTCLMLPAEGPSVLAVAALTREGGKATYSNFGTERTALAAPGGEGAENDDTVISPVPRQWLVDDGDIDAAGNLLPGAGGNVARSCDSHGTCAFYLYMSGTSQAAPHVSAVAALVVARFGHPDPNHPGTLTMDPGKVGSVLISTATPHACPDPPQLFNPAPEEGVPDVQTCTGSAKFNGFYGHGILNAYAAVTYSAGT